MIDLLPEEIASTILIQLGLRDLLHLARVCRRLFSVVHDREDTWQALHQSMIANSASPAASSGIPHQSISRSRSNTSALNASCGSRAMTASVSTAAPDGLTWRIAFKNGYEARLTRLQWDRKTLLWQLQADIQKCRRRIDSLDSCAAVEVEGEAIKRASLSAMQKARQARTASLQWVPSSVQSHLSRRVQNSNQESEASAHARMGDLVAGIIQAQRRASFVAEDRAKQVGELDRCLAAMAKAHSHLCIVPGLGGSG